MYKISDNSRTFTCEVEGKTYKENEIFYPKHDCFVCRCTKDFDGKFEAPACKRRGCDSEIRHFRDIENNCAPVYYKRDRATALCCPSTFMCRKYSNLKICIRYLIKVFNFFKTYSIRWGYGNTIKWWIRLVWCNSFK